MVAIRPSAKADPPKSNKTAQIRNTRDNKMFIIRDNQIWRVEPSPNPCGKRVISPNQYRLTRKNPAGLVGSMVSTFQPLVISTAGEELSFQLFVECSVVLSR